MRIPADSRATGRGHVSSPFTNQAAIIPLGVVNAVLDPVFESGGQPSSWFPWQLGPGWTLTNEVDVFPVPEFFTGTVNRLVHETGYTDAAYQLLGKLPPAQYEISFVISAPRGSDLEGSVTPWFGPTEYIPFSTVGLVTFSIDAPSGLAAAFSNILFVPSSDFNGSISYIRVTPSYNVDTGLVTDGDFTAATGAAWTLDGYVFDAANDYCDLSAGDSTSFIKQAVTTVAGRVYYVEFDWVKPGTYSASFDVSLDDTANLVDTTSGSIFTGTAPTSGTVLLSFIPQTNDDAYAYPASVVGQLHGTAGSLVISGGTMQATTYLDNVVIYESMQEPTNLMASYNGGFGTDTLWTKDTGWTIDAVTTETAICDGTDAARIYQDVSAAPGRYFLVCYDVVTRSAGTVQVEVGGTQGNEVSTVGRHRQIIKAGDGNGNSTLLNCISFLSNDFNGSIDNVEMYWVQKVETGDRRVFDDIKLSCEGSGSVATGGFPVSFVGESGDIETVDVSAKGLTQFGSKRGLYGSKGETTVVIAEAPGADLDLRLNGVIR